MNNETITIWKGGIDTGEAVKSVGDLKENVKVLKSVLDGLQIGTEKYQETLSELKVNQNALKDAMYATTQTGENAEENMKSLSDAATGTAESYNGLVHRMAALKEELRATDVSTEQGKQRFKELAEQVNSVNDKLKDMDALQGNFQRNVGNYESHWKGMAKNADALKKGLDSVGKGVDGVKNGFEAMAANPTIAIIGIIAQVAMKLSASLKEDETMTNALGKAMDALKPIMDFFKGILDKLVDLLSDVIEKVSEFVSNNGLIQKVINGVMGVGNAILQFVIAPFKGVISAIKVFKEQGISGFKDASNAFAEEMKNGVSFKNNFQAGQAVGDAIVKGIKSKKEEVKEASEELVKELTIDLSKIDEEIEKEFDKTLSAFDKAEAEANARANKIADAKLKAQDKYLAHLLTMNDIEEQSEEEKESRKYQIILDANQRRLEALEQFAQEALQRGDLDAMLQYEQEAADLSVTIEENAAIRKAQIREKDKADQEAKAKNTIATMMGVASGISSILGSIADMYESDEENAEKNAEKIKALRITEATINTITGAIGAYMQAAASIPPPAGIILGAVQAAAVTAAGIAQIANIKKQQIGGSTSSSSSSIGSFATTAPAITTEVANVRNVTSASEEDRLNEMAKDQKVYILQSDIEASNTASRARVAEASF